MIITFINVEFNHLSRCTTGSRRRASRMQQKNNASKRHGEMTVEDEKALELAVQSLEEEQRHMDNSLDNNLDSNLDGFHQHPLILPVDEPMGVPELVYSCSINAATVDPFMSSVVDYTIIDIPNDHQPQIATDEELTMLTNLTWDDSQMDLLDSLLDSLQTGFNNNIVFVQQVCGIGSYILYHIVIIILLNNVIIPNPFQHSISSVLTCQSETSLFIFIFYFLLYH